MQDGTICPLAKGHSCDIPIFLALVPKGKSCCQQGNCMRSFIPALKRCVEHRIGVVNCAGTNEPSEEDLLRVRLAIAEVL